MCAPLPRLASLLAVILLLGLLAQLTDPSPGLFCTLFGGNKKGIMLLPHPRSLVLGKRGFPGARQTWVQVQPPVHLEVLTKFMRALQAPVSSVTK